MKTKQSGGPPTELGTLKRTNPREFVRRITAAMRGGALLVDAARALGVSVPSLKIYLQDPELREIPRLGRGRPRKPVEVVGTSGETRTKKKDSPKRKKS